MLLNRKYKNERKRVQVRKGAKDKLLPFFILFYFGSIFFISFLSQHVPNKQDKRKKQKPPTNVWCGVPVLVSPPMSLADLLNQVAKINSIITYLYSIDYSMTVFEQNLNLFFCSSFAFFFIVYCTNAKKKGLPFSKLSTVQTQKRTGIRGEKKKPKAIFCTKES